MEITKDSNLISVVMKTVWVLSDNRCGEELAEVAGGTLRSTTL
jgi:hypothetical protein